MTIPELIESIDYTLDCDNDTIPTTQEDLMTIKNSLEKDVPDAPIVSGKYDYLCPNCKECLPVNFEDVAIYGEIVKRCVYCGQLLDWDNV